MPGTSNLIFSLIVEWRCDVHAPLLRLLLSRLERHLTEGSVVECGVKEPVCRRGSAKIVRLADGCMKGLLVLSL